MRASVKFGSYCSALQIQGPKSREVMRALCGEEILGLLGARLLGQEFVELRRGPLKVPLLEQGARDIDPRNLEILR